MSEFISRKKYILGLEVMVTPNEYPDIDCPSGYTKL